MSHPLQTKSLRAILARCLALLDPPTSLNVWRWAEENRRLGRDVSAKPGRYLVSVTPYMREPQEAFYDPDVMTTVLYMAKRTGKTEGEMNLVGSVIAQNPVNILIVYPTLDSGKKYSKQFLVPMVRSTPCLRRLIRDTRSRDANNTILSKEFPGGTISIIGSNSPSAFRQVRAPIVICDEIDAMEEGSEGCPITLAFGRAENYPDTVQVLSSTATRLFRVPEAGEENPGTTGSRIHDWYLKSDQRKWFCKCPDCGTFHVLAWANVKWPEGHKHEQAWYECPDCHSHWNDEKRLAAICAGEWRATAKFRGVRGYWLNGLNTTFPAKKGYKSKLHQFAAEFFDAYTSGEAARIAWKNTFLCEPHIEETEKIDAQPLFERCEDYAPDRLPEQICIVVLAVDVQGDRLEYEFSGMGEGEEDWGIEYGKIQGDPEREEVWESLKQQLARTFKRTDGVELKVDCCAIDHAHKGGRVRKFVKTCGHPRCYPVYGTSGKQSLIVVPHLNKHYRMKLYSVNTDTGKDTVFARLRLKEPGPRYMHFPRNHGYEKQNNSYFEQLTAEEVRITYRKGFAERTYEKIRARNEALDLRVYRLAAIDILRPQVKQIAANLIAGRKPKEYELKPSNEPVKDMGQNGNENVPHPKPKPQAPQRRVNHFTGRRGKWL